ncbi:MAG: tRNA epoxyqueuosine(34) reductase QueG [Lachnospiraceae bacterium]|nr:tRNA epoxyqueuosine(34) reductase QueG [Lachnospiraceae bacterium]
MKTTAESIINEFAIENGFSDVGICSAEDFEDLRQSLTNTEDTLLGFVEKDIEKRISPRLTMPNAKSIIVVAKGYSKNVLVQSDGKLRGYISIGAIGEDYHIFMKRKLSELERLLITEFNAECMSFADTGPLVDRAVAIRSGIGYKGKNGNVITKNGGSAVFFGYIITNLHLKFSEKSNFHCSNCNKCINACPTGAIGVGEFNIEKCISYLTQQKRLLTRDEMKLIGLNLYGCDVCQITCKNNQKPLEDVTVLDDIMPLIEDILNMTNSTFKKRFGATAMGWRGATVIKRNALAVLGNIGTEESIILLGKYLKNENALLRHTAVRALMNTGLNSGQALLKSCYQYEENKAIKDEIFNCIRR